MGTTAQKFYPSTTDHDGTWGTDVRKLLDTAAGAIDDTTKADFGTDTSQRTITFDPYTTRSTVGDASTNFGWGVNASGSDGMSATSTARRVIPSGVWTFNCRVSVTVVQTGTGNDTTQLTAYVYKVAGDGTRTLQWSQASAAEAVTTITGVGVQLFSWSTASKPELELDADETIHVAFTVTSIGVAVTGQVITFRTQGTNVTDTQNTWMRVPSPGVRTILTESVTVTAVGTSALTVGTKTITGTVYDSDGNPANAATVKLFRQSDDVKISTDTTGADGVYLFTRADDDTDQWYCVGFSDATHHGTSDRDLAAS